jgi:hypothetical protein
MEMLIAKKMSLGMMTVILSLCSINGSKAVMASCSIPKVAILTPESVGQVGWTVPTFPRIIDNKEAFLKRLEIPVLKQVGPARWEETEISIPHGEEVVVVKSVSESAFEVKRPNGEHVVLSYDNALTFDYRKCPATSLLEDRIEYGGLYHGIVEHFPMRVKPNARPVDNVGKWIDPSLVRYGEFVICRHYHQKLFVGQAMECSPVVESHNFDDFYFLHPDEELESALTE